MLQHPERAWEGTMAPSVQEGDTYDLLAKAYTATEYLDIAHFSATLG
jgi:hypothetical protein